jgi:peptidoglycan hydrolase-like amidase/cell division septation protein DedD
MASVAATIAAAMALAASCRTVPRSGPAAHAPGAPAAVENPAPPAAADVPIVRVGVLTDVPRATISAERGLVVRAADGRERRIARATFVSVSTSAARSSFRVQIASVTDEASARDIAARARAAGVEPTQRWNPDTRTHQLRVGDFPTREQAQALSGRLAAVGLAGGWVVEEAVSSMPGRIRLLETTDDLTRATILAVDAADLVAVDGKTYRGSLEVRAGDVGLTVVNVLDVESYLRGVVPNELSPTAFPAIEGLKAQAVAARTYVLRNRGGYAARGYDICATPACQMYGGQSTEHPLSDRAVQETRGIAAYHRGSLINALYTSTCGGHTENGSNIFEGEATPYLVGVTCAAEREAWASIQTRARPLALGDEAGLNRDVALLVALGVVEPAVYSATAVGGTATDAELRAWTGKLAAVLGRETCHAGQGPVTRRAGFFRHVVGALCWDDRANLLAPGDEDYLLRIEDRAELVDEGERRAAAVLLQEGILTLFPDNTLRPEAPVTRVHALTTLARAALEAGPASLVSAEFRQAAPGLLVVAENGVEREYVVDPAARLFRALGGNRLAASELSLAAGDAVRFVAEQGRVVYLEADQSLLGASADRSSKVYRWEVRMTPAELGTAVSRYGDVGAVRDVSPRRFGVSGRVTELAVTGSAGDLLLRGLRVRWGLGLRENLFVVDRERDPSGTVKQFIFTGKGWGHGVGLCQVGAFGMAQAGSTYDRILGHYYTGITLQHAY